MRWNCLSERSTLASANGALYSQSLLFMGKTHLTFNLDQIQTIIDIVLDLKDGFEGDFMSVIYTPDAIQGYFDRLSRHATFMECLYLPVTELAFVSLLLEGLFL